MAWLELHQSLRHHRKLLAVAEALDVPEAHAMGHLLSLWLWCLDNVSDVDGRLEGVTRRTIAHAAQWPGDPDLLFGGLVGAGWLDQRDDGLYVHDWYDYAGKLMEQRAEERERSRRRRAARRPADGHTNGSAPTNGTGGRPPDDRQTTVGTVPNLTLPNETMVGTQGELTNPARPREDDRAVTAPPSTPESSGNKTQAETATASEQETPQTEPIADDGRENRPPRAAPLDRSPAAELQRAHYRQTGTDPDETTAARELPHYAGLLRKCKTVAEGTAFLAEYPRPVRFAGEDYYGDWRERRARSPGGGGERLSASAMFRRYGEELRRRDASADLGPAGHVIGGVAQPL